MKENTLIIGSLGRMGRRYSAILDYLNKPHTGWDMKSGQRCPRLNMFTHVIIATTTGAHADWLEECADAKVRRVLCEKPVCMDSAKVATLSRRVPKTYNVVCNWRYVHDWRKPYNAGECDVAYSNWYTGPHGGLWDCCQLVYLDRDMPTITAGPVFEAAINSEMVMLNDIDWSYVYMLEDWYQRPANLWNMDDALKMERKVEQLSTMGAQCTPS